MIKKYLQNELKKKFKEVIYSHEYDNHILITSPRSIYPLLQFLREELGFIMLIDICGVDNLNRPPTGPLYPLKRFECVYHLLNMSEHSRLRVRVPLDINEKLPTATTLWPGADWFEREVWDMFGIEFEDRKLERLLTHRNFVGHPLRKNYKQREQEIPPPPREDKDNFVNIANPATLGLIGISAELEGETVKGAQVEIGYLHRCFEKICEDLFYNQIIPYAGRLNYSSAELNSVGWCCAVEKLMGIEITDRAKVLRMIMAELSRITSHFLCIGNMATSVKAITALTPVGMAREIIFSLFEKICGSRLIPSLSRIGGMAMDIPPSWIDECREGVKMVRKKLAQLRGQLSGGSIWPRRTRVDPISAESAIAWGYTGPCLRACGVNYDLRKTSPYYFYQDIDFEVPLGIRGDCYDRYLVMMEEIEQSIQIIFQLLDNIPLGPINIDDSRVSLPEKGAVYGQLDSFARHKEFIEKGIAVSLGEIYSATEGANGELGFYIISDGGTMPYRVKVRPPCFSILQSFPQVAKGILLSDATVSLASMNIVGGELDR